MSSINQTSTVGGTLADILLLLGQNFTGQGDARALEAAGLEQISAFDGDLSQLIALLTEKLTQEGISVESLKQEVSAMAAASGGIEQDKPESGRSFTAVVLEMLLTAAAPEAPAINCVQPSPVIEQFVQAINRWSPAAQTAKAPVVQQAQPKVNAQATVADATADGQTGVASTATAPASTAGAQESTLLANQEINQPVAQGDAQAAAQKQDVMIVDARGANESASMPEQQVLQRAASPAIVQHVAGSGAPNQSVVKDAAQVLAAAGTDHPVIETATSTASAIPTIEAVQAATAMPVVHHASDIAPVDVAQRTLSEAGAVRDTAGAGDLLDQLAEGLTTVGAGQRIIIRLNPPELGSVRADFRTDGDAVTCVLRVDNPQTLASVQREATALVERLNESGVNLRQVSVEMGSSGAGGQTAQGWNSFGDGSQGRGGYQHQDAGVAWQLPENSGASSEPQHAGASAGEGLLNVWI
jgi:flagellar hook-length control protein FliK